VQRKNSSISILFEKMAESEFIFPFLPVGVLTTASLEKRVP